MAQEQEYADALPKGYKLEGYEIVRVLGVGGFGMTYLGFDDNLNKAVAIKEYLPGDISRRDASLSVIPRSSNDKAEFEWGLERFLSEAQDIARFDHPNIISVRRFFRAHGTAYIVMDYAEGELLSQLLKREDKLNEARLKKVLFPILDGVEEVHKSGLIHRDIKPDNIIIRDDGVPVLIDFGAARQQTAGRSRSMTAVLTPGYAPHEQYSTKGKQGAWTDVYALAAVAYRALTGSKPEDSPDRMEEDELVPATEAAKGQASSVFLQAIDRGLSVKAKERPQTIADFRSLLVEEKSIPSVAPAKKDSQEEQEKNHFREFVFVCLIAITIVGMWENTATRWGWGSGTAKYRLGNNYYYGTDGVKKNYKEAVQWYRLSAEQGNAQGQANLGYMYNNGRGVEKNYQKALKWYSLSAEQGNAHGQSNLGEMYYNGRGVKKNYQEALKWSRLSAQQGNAHGQSNLGEMYYNGRGVKKNYQEAFKWFRLSAEQGYAFGQFWLGHMYQNGRGVEKNYQEALKWFRLSAEQGDAYGQFWLGHMYHNGWGVEKNYQKALKWYRLSVEQGNAWGQVNLGVMYHNGEGVARNYQQAVKWYRLSAEQGNASGQNELGVMYSNGYGVKENYQKAVKWFRLSAEQGNAVGQIWLGDMYYHGRGVRQSQNEACKWYRKAIAQGHNEVKQLVEEYC